MPEDVPLDRFATPDASERRADAESASDDADVALDGAGDERERTDDAGEATAEGDDAVGTGEEATGETGTKAGVSPAVSTFGWSPGGGECAACGASVERRWRADGERGGALVCADCKEW